MNWSRALSWLWVVGTICWIVWMTAIFWGPVSDLSHRLDLVSSDATPLYDNYDAEVARVAAEREQLEAKCPDVLSGPPPAVEYIGEPPLQVPVIVDVAELLRRPNWRWCEDMIAGELPSVEEEILQRRAELSSLTQYFRRERNQQLLYWIASTVIPPVIVFAIGCGLFWTVAGLGPEKQ